MSRDIIWTSRFKNDYKNLIKRKLNINLIDDAIRILAQGKTLPAHYNDHSLSGIKKYIYRFIIDRCVFYTYFLINYEL